MNSIYKKRLASVFKRKGVFGALKHILYKTYRNNIARERFVFGAGSRVFEKNTVTIERLTIVSYTNMAAVPSNLCHKALEIQTSDLIRRDWEMKFAPGVYLWAAYDASQEAVGLAWSARKQHYNFPFFPLTDRDCVLHDVFIFEKYRNRGYGASMMHQVVEQILRSGMERVYIDIATWNVPSLKMIGKLEYDLLGLARYTVGKKGKTITWRNGAAEKFENLIR